MGVKKSSDEDFISKLDKMTFGSMKATELKEIILIMDALGLTKKEIKVAISEWFIT